MSQYRFFIIFLLGSISHNLCAQSLQLDFPHFAGQGWYLRVFQGQGMDTIAKGAIDEHGKLYVSLADSHKSFRGMSQWMLTLGGGLDVIFAGGEDVSVSCPEVNPGEGNIHYNDTQENTYLIQRYRRQQEIFARVDAMRSAIEAYKEDKDLLFVFESALQKQIMAYSLLVAETANNKLYAARFAEIVDITHGLPRNIATTDQQKIASQTKDFIIHQLDMEALYTSGHWQGVLGQWLEIYAHNETSEKETDMQVIGDYNVLHNRIEDKEVADAFAFIVHDLLAKNGKEDLAHKLNVVGHKAPDFAVNNTRLSAIKGKRLLFFYGSFCDLCQDEVGVLTRQHKALKKRNITVIGIDTEPTKNKRHPWSYDTSDKDYQVYQAYNVTQTPVYLLIDEEGMIVDRYTKLEDIRIN